MSHSPRKIKLNLPEKVRLGRTSNTIEPLEQGDLDALCGVYACINAIRWICRNSVPITQKQSNLMFEHAIGYLFDKKILRTTILDGMGDKTCLKLLNVLAKQLSCQQNTCVRITKDTDKKTTAAFIKERINAGDAVIIHVKGVYNHFSVITDYDANRWHLFDSDGMHYIYHASIKPSNYRKQARYKFTRSGVIAISKLPVRSTL